MSPNWYASAVFKLMHCVAFTELCHNVRPRRIASNDRRCLTISCDDSGEPSLIPASLATQTEIPTPDEDSDTSALRLTISTPNATDSPSSV